MFLLLTSCSYPPPSEGGQPPNIILIMADDMAFDDLAYMPKTINLIRNNGVSFDQYIVTMSLCCPSRVSILRGQYPHNSQITGNNAPEGGFEKAYGLGLEESTIAVWLQDAGYKTALIGKYLNGYPAELKPSYIPPGWTEWYVPAGDAVYNDSAYTGFNYVLNENGQLVEYGNSPDDYTTDVFAEKAVEFIQNSSESGEPFFLYLSTYAPHKPSTPAPRHAEMFTDLTLPDKPSINEADIEDKSRFFRNPPLSESELADLQKAYQLRIQSLQAVDDMMEDVHNALLEEGLLNNTYVFFSSDNGYHLGEHRLPAGKNTYFEEDIHVPLLVLGPNIRPGSSVNYLTANIDLAPTIAEIANVVPPDFVDGRSLLRFFDSEWTPSWRNAVVIARGFSSYKNLASLGTPPSLKGEQEPIDSVMDQRAGGQFIGLRTNDYTYVEFLNGDVELYDLKKDPYQLTNIASTANPRLLSRLHNWLAQLSACQAQICTEEDIRP